AVRARRTRHVPTVLSRPEIGVLLEALRALPTKEPYALMAQLMYGAGLRLMECCRLRVKEVDLERGQLTVRGGKGDKDRYVMLPETVKERLRQQMDWRRGLHQQDVARGLGRVDLPTALKEKFPRAAYELGRQFVFASTRLSRC